MPKGDKYIDLTRYLETCGKDAISLTVEEISNIVGGLPSWVRNPDRIPWANDRQSSFSAGWLNAGYTVRSDITKQLITFTRQRVNNNGRKNMLSYMDLRKDMCRIARSMWERRLTNAAGGNFAVRADDNLVLITPSLMSERKHCDLQPDDMILIDYDQNIIEGTGRLSRESDMHTGLLRSFPGISATIHAHPFWCMSFVCQAKPIPNISEATMGRGSVGCIPYTKAYTPELAANVMKYFEERRKLVEMKPIGVILPLHGVVVSGPDIFMAYSMLERIEADAFCHITKEMVMRVTDEPNLGDVSKASADGGKL